MRSNEGEFTDFKRRSVQNMNCREQPQKEKSRSDVSERDQLNQIIT